LGDGHPGIWKIVREFNCPGEIREILDWFHLIENLHKVGGSVKRLNQAETLLWQGKIDDTLALISPLKAKQAQNFCQYGSPAFMVISFAYLNNWSVRVACRRHSGNYLNKQANNFSFIRSKFLNP